ncbi:ferritin-like domain-containing protein [Kiloniella laminariae]|uniref:Ferritin-like domain-containing protein n=1 Tax=Kiloniella laminariae TaxID=454162 RepID=A0ABT4LEC5_9PROT|nr:ferritin-like domain-containing protein [Kiloniella laminariae]MCZ4279444.1 ferritin-like domain-containing protein [Kiloniella laminariae]
MSILPKTLAEAAAQALCIANSQEKSEYSRLCARAWQAGTISRVGLADIPPEPAREESPVLVPPTEVPRRKVTQDPEGRIALLHALAHIELHAINLCWDIIVRFARTPMPKEFYDDWVAIADDEARHHLLLCERLKQLGSHYGALPAHAGLWQGAEVTEHNLKARLAVVPMVLEARGLDVTPGIIVRLRAVKDFESADRLQIIYDDEISHVARGKRWFEYLCQQDAEDPIESWQNIILTLFKGRVRSPFNTEGRDLAGFPIDYYGPVADL